MSLKASFIGDLPIHSAICASRGKGNSSRSLRLFQAHLQSRATSNPDSASFRKQRVRAAIAAPSLARCVTESLCPSSCALDQASAGALSDNRRNPAGPLPFDWDESQELDL